MHGKCFSQCMTRGKYSFDTFHEATKVSHSHLGVIPTILLIKYEAIFQISIDLMKIEE